MPNLPRPTGNAYVTPGNAGQHALVSGIRALYLDPQLAPRIERFRQAADPLDCLEELHLARALLEEFLENYQQQNEWAQCWQQAKVEGTNDPPPPVRWLTLDEALKFIKVIGDLAKGIQGMRVADSMSKAEVKYKVWQLAKAVEEVVLQQDVEDGWKETMLERIKAKWLGIWI